MTTVDEIEMQMKTARARLGLSAKDIAKALNTIQPMPFNAAHIFAPNIPIIEWSGWRKTTSMWPRKSIAGKIIFGRINKRSRLDWMPVSNVRTPRIREYATNKELFEAKLKGVA